MKYRSTRDASLDHGLSQAILRGLAPDGGLYVPHGFPTFDRKQFDPAAPLAETAATMLAPFAAEDPLADSLRDICLDAWNFEIPSRPLEEGVELLELFHGPTAAFKDVGARFLAAAMSRMNPGGVRTILVATSGDTGGAIAAAFHRKPGIEVGILFPKDGVSPLQRQQLTCWGDNVRAFAVDGVFDDCQRLVKAAFGDEAWRSRRNLTSANSINIGRLLPQSVYYAAASLRVASRSGKSASFFVPSGNVGNACAALWARVMGFPIGRITMATNRNRAVPDLLRSGVWEPRPSVATPANAMDVGNPSNMERVRDLFPDLDELRQAFKAEWSSDEELIDNIRWAFEQWGRVICPHTAAAVHAYRRQPLTPAVLVATAHPAKFRETVEPALGVEVPLPPVLEALMTRPAEARELPADLATLQAEMDR